MACASERTALRVDCIETIEALEPVWRAIERQNPSVRLFQSWSWNCAWARYVLPSIKGARLRSFVASSSEGRAVAIVPCFARNVMGSAFTLTALLGHRMSFCNDVVAACPEDESVAASLLAGLQQELRPREIVHLKHLNGSSAFTRALRDEAAAEVQCHRLVIARHDRHTDPYRWMSRKNRQSLRWHSNKLERRYGARYEVADPDETDAGFERFVRLHQARFEHRGEETLLKGANLNFLRAAVLPLLRAGKAELFELRAADQVIASLLGIIDLRRYYLVNLGFDMKFAEFSPMKLLITRAMRHAFEDLGCTHFELGPDYESYKRMWRPEAEASYMACLRQPRMLSSIAAAGYTWAYRRALAARGAHGSAR